MSREVPRAVLTSVLTTPTFTFECTRSRDLTKDDQIKLEYVRKVHGVTLSHTKALKALLLRFFEFTSLAAGSHGIQNLPLKVSRKASDVLVAKGCFQVLRSCVTITDEVDMILELFCSQTNFPLEAKKDLLSSPERWDLAAYILYAVFTVHAELQSQRQNQSTHLGWSGHIEPLGVFLQKQEELEDRRTWCFIGRTAAKHGSCQFFSETRRDTLELVRRIVSVCFEFEVRDAKVSNTR